VLLEPAEVDRAALLRLLADAYGLAVRGLTFLPVGGDSHNYRAEDERGQRWFVNVKRVPPFPRARGGRGDLDAAYRLAIALRDRAGLDFLSCPIATRDGALVTLLGRLPLSVFPFLEEQPSGLSPDAERQAIVAAVRRLHRATPDVRDLDLPVEGFEPDFAPALLAALERAPTLDVTIGPHAAWLRERLLANRDRLLGLLARFQGLRTVVLAAGRDDWVVTHGEPDSNALWDAQGRLRLVDCGELCLTPPERDLLWLRTPDRRPLPCELYDLRWVLSEVAEYADYLSRPHGHSPEDERCRRELAEYLA
jgi:hypothetical protein